MTKYQRGELMEGWNDCPVPLLLSRSSSSSSVSSAKSRKRMSRMVAPATTAAPDTAAARRGPPSALAPPPVSARDQPAAPGTAQPAAGEENTLNTEATGETLRSIVAARALPERDAEFFAKRLIEPYEALGAEHKAFVTRIVNGLAASEPSAKLKGEVLNYMMVNSGVSGWCVPLKKLVETA